MTQLVTILSREFTTGLGTHSFLSLTTPLIWGLILASFCLTPLILGVRPGHRTWKSRLQSLGERISDCWASLLGQSGNFKPSILALVWLLVSYILMQLVFSELTSIMAVPKRIHVSSFKDLVNRQEFKHMKIYMDTRSYDHFKVSEV